MSIRRNDLCALLTLLMENDEWFNFSNKDVIGSHFFTFPLCMIWKMRRICLIPYFTSPRVVPTCPSLSTLLSNETQPVPVSFKRMVNSSINYIFMQPAINFLTDSVNFHFDIYCYPLNKITNLNTKYIFPKEF